MYRLFSIAEISLMDYLEVEPFKSDQVINQQLLHVQSGPEALTEQYRSCDPKPDLHQFTPLFDNGCNAMSLYSNPDYFFIEWRKSIEREAIIMKITEQSVSPIQLLYTCNHLYVASVGPVHVCTQTCVHWAYYGTWILSELIVTTTCVLLTTFLIKILILYNL